VGNSEQREAIEGESFLQRFLTEKQKKEGNGDTRGSFARMLNHLGRCLTADTGFTGGGEL